MKAPRALLVAPLLLLFGILATSCVAVTNPEGWGAPVFDGDTVYFLESHNRIAAAPLPAGATTITLSWVFPDKNAADQKNISFKAIYGRPVVDTTHVYFTSYDGGVFALDKTTGKPAWRIQASAISGNLAGGVAVNGDVLVFGTTDGHLYAVKTADGSTADGWPKGGITVGSGVWAAPVFANGMLVVATMGGSVRGLSPTDHSQKWNFSVSGAFADLALLPDGRLFAPSLDRHFYLLDPASGELKGDFKAADWIWTKPAVVNGTAYFGDFGGNVYAVDISGSTPTQRWRYVAGSKRVKSQPQIVDDVLVIADLGPVVHFIGATDGKLLNNVPISHSGTIRADIAQKDGFAYISTTGGGLFRADPKTRSVTEITVVGRQ